MTTSYTLMVQFRVRARGFPVPKPRYLVVRVKAFRGNTAGDIARSAVRLARYEADDCFPYTLEVVGISDGRRVAGEWVTVGLDPRARSVHTMPA